MTHNVNKIPSEHETEEARPAGGTVFILRRCNARLGGGRGAARHATKYRVTVPARCSRRRPRWRSSVRMLRPVGAGLGRSPGHFSPRVTVAWPRPGGSSPHVPSSPGPGPASGTGTSAGPRQASGWHPRPGHPSGLCRLQMWEARGTLSGGGVAPAGTLRLQKPPFLRGSGRRPGPQSLGGVRTKLQSLHLRRVVSLEGLPAPDMPLGAGQCPAIRGKGLRGNTGTSLTLPLTSPRHLPSPHRDTASEQANWYRPKTAIPGRSHNKTGSPQCRYIR